MNTIIDKLRELIQYVAPNWTLTNKTKAGILELIKGLKENTEIKIDIDDDQLDDIMTTLEKKSTSAKDKEIIKEKGELIIQAFDKYMVAINNAKNTINDNDIDDLFSN